MENSVLKKLLIEYEKKREFAEKELILKKTTLYNQNPRLLEIENSLNEYSIKTMKRILANNSTSLLEDLQDKCSKLKKERINILESLSLTEQYLKPSYECNICNDTGFVLDSNSLTTMCNCLKQRIYNLEYNKSNLNNLVNQNFEKFSINCFSNTVNKELYKSDISPRENMKLIKNICDNFINNFDDPKEKNLLFIGNTGLGKTFLSSCIANELLRMDKTVLYQTAPNMLDSIIDCRFNKEHCNPNIINNILNVDLLIIDDLGTENINSLKFSELFNIINTRLLNSSKTIISTNLNLKNLFSTYDERIVSRFAENYNICRFFRRRY